MLWNFFFLTFLDCDFAFIRAPYRVVYCADYESAAKKGLINIHGGEEEVAAEEEGEYEGIIEGDEGEEGEEGEDTSSSKEKSAGPVTVGKTQLPSQVDCGQKAVESVESGKGKSEKNLATAKVLSGTSLTSLTSLSEVLSRLSRPSQSLSEAVGKKTSGKG